VSDRVVLVPGLGFAGAELLPLAVRLRRKGYRVSVFWHCTGKPPLEDSARRLWDKATKQSEDVVHFVGHSLGGLVVLRMLANHRWDRPGRIVTMGTPHAGLGAARRFAGVPGGRRLLWPGVLAAANCDPIAVPTDRELGVLAGDRNLFFGSVIVPGQASDTLIGVEETRHPGCRAHVTVSETHAGMLLAGRVASHIDSFLREGRFPTRPAADG
jgi:pimeloyl-ACP methyl ester carboxylesterase